MFYAFCWREENPQHARLMEAQNNKEEEDDDDDEDVEVTQA